MNNSSRFGLVLVGLGLLAVVVMALAQDAGVVGFEPLVSVKELMEQTITPATDLLLPPCEGCHLVFNPAVVNGQ